MERSVATRTSSEMRYSGLAELTCKRIDPAELIVGEPILDDLAGDAFAPFALRRHAPPDRGGGEQDARSGERYKQRRLGPKCRRVAPLESVEEMPIPIIQQVLHQQLQQDDENEDDGQAPGHPTLIGLARSGRL